MLNSHHKHIARSQLPTVHFLVVINHHKVPQSSTTFSDDAMLLPFPSHSFPHHIHFEDASYPIIILFVRSRAGRRTEGGICRRR
jgi:hypothetical protein